MGNLNLHLLTSSEEQVLRIELEDFEGEKRYAEYSTFRVSVFTDMFSSFSYACIKIVAKYYFFCVVIFLGGF